MPKPFDRREYDASRAVSNIVRPRFLQYVRGYCPTANVLEHDLAIGEERFDTDIEITIGVHRLRIEEEVRLSYWDSGWFPYGGAHVPAERPRKVEGDLYMQISADGKFLWICPCEAIKSCNFDIKKPKNRTQGTLEKFYLIPEDLVDIYIIGLKSPSLLPGDNRHRYLETFLEGK